MANRFKLKRGEWKIARRPTWWKRNAGFIVVFVLVVIGATYLALHITTR